MIEPTAPYTDLPLSATTDGITIPVRAVPRASRNAIDGVVEGALRVRLAAPPVDGAANKALLGFLAELLDLPRRNVELVAGDHGRRKVVRVRGLSAEEIRQRLAANGT